MWGVGGPRRRWRWRRRGGGWWRRGTWGLRRQRTPGVGVRCVSFLGVEGRWALVRVEGGGRGRWGLSMED
jgi:hypothetical protein